MGQIKNIRMTALGCTLALLLAGCGQSQSSARQSDSGNKVENAINEQMKAAETETTETTAAAGTQESGGIATATSAGAVDYDLTLMNSDMVYSTVYQMMVDPESYVGKTVRMSGPFYPYTNQDETVYYPACIIEDATACCAQGMEFVLPGTEYPDGYPEDGTVVTVSGTFETYQEDDYTYCHLVNAVLESTGQ